MAQDAPAVGIDLGTTYSVVGVYRKRKVEIIANDDGKRTTPSYVAFTEEDVYVGDAAKEMATENTLFDSKRLIGRRYEDPDVQKDLANWPFRVMNDGGMPKYEIYFDGIGKFVSAEEVSAKVLDAMKKTAEDSLEVTVTKAVITVPAYFNDSQRKATIDACGLAELEVIGLLNEPTAAAMAFGFGKGKHGTVLIFDLGGGTFDVTVLDIRGDNFKMRAHGGDTHLGGQDLDNCLMDYCISDIQNTMKIDVRAECDAELLHELRTSCELAKRKLSTLAQATVNVFLSRYNKVYKKDITRSTFEALCSEHFKRVIDVLPGVLKDAEASIGDINDVVLVGGSTRIPKIRSMVKEFFGGKEPNKSINPDEAVAMGAAIQAAALTGAGGASKVIVKEVSSLDLGVATSNGLMAVLIPRNSELPCHASRPFTTASDQQEEATFTICQGPRARAEDNHVLGEFTLPVPALAQGDVHIDTTFSLAEDGVLSVTAKERSTGETMSGEWQSEARLSQREIQQLIEKAQQMRVQDDAARDEARRERFGRV